MKTNNTKKNESKINLVNKTEVILCIDTIINYSLEGVSSEGAEVYVTYKKGSIVFAEFILYSSISKAIVKYDFKNKDKIKVNQKNYSYNKPIDEVDSSGIKQDFELNYFIDSSGKITKNNLNTKKIVDIFSEFKKQIPQKLIQNP